MNAHEQHQQVLEDQLTEVWGLIDELGDLSVRLRRAADAAVEALGLPNEGDRREHAG